MALPRRQHVALIFFFDYCTSKVTSELRNPASAFFAGEFEFYSEVIRRKQISRIKLQDYLEKKNVYRLSGENNKL